MCRCARAAPALFAHLNLIITLYGGAALATAARLKWDPSTYVVLREMLPGEYRACAAGLTGAGVALLLLPHIAALAQHSVAVGCRRALLYVYAMLLVALMVAEVSFAAWLSVRVSAWLNSEEAQQLAEALELRNHLRPVLKFLGRWHPLPHHIDSLIHEAEEDVPRNAYCGVVVGAVLALVQPLAVLAALLAARRPRLRTQSELSLQPHPPPYSVGVVRRGGYTAVPASPSPQRLRTAYKNGRIVIL